MAYRRVTRLYSRAGELDSAFALPEVSRRALSERNGSQTLAYALPYVKEPSLGQSSISPHPVRCVNGVGRVGHYTWPKPGDKHFKTPTLWTVETVKSSLDHASINRAHCKIQSDPPTKHKPGPRRPDVSCTFTRGIIPSCIVVPHPQNPISNIQDFLSLREMRLSTYRSGYVFSRT